MNILEKLLKKGFFPIQLPPNFNSYSFGDKHQEIKNGFNRIIKANKKKDPTKIWTKPDKYTVARSSYYRRTTTILNPISYFALANLISENWDEINTHYRKSKLSLSKPTIDDKSIRAISLTKFSQLYEKKIIKSSGYRFALVTDISSYFPSIYTHSISWALHGKDKSKNNIKTNEKLLGNEIDTYCRNAQDGQTIGLPIGSDTSHIISEIIGTSIDYELRKKLNKTVVGFRYVDDFFLFFKNRVKAENALAILTSIINSYELEINASKTKIIETKELIEESWRYSVKKLKISPEIKKQRNDIHNYFSSIFNLEKRFKDESIAKYSIKQLTSSIIKKDNWDIVESYLLKVAYSFPNTIEIICRFLITYAHFGIQLNKKNIKRFIHSLLSEHSNASHHNEVCWLLWLSKELAIKIPTSIVMTIFNMNNSICTLILLDMRNKKILDNDCISQEKLNLYADSTALDKENWLVSYEAGKRKWLSDNIEFIKKHNAFSILLDNNISFYDEDAEPPLLFTRKNENNNLELEKSSNELLESDEDLSDKFEFDEQDEEYFDNQDNNNEYNDEWED